MLTEQQFLLQLLELCQRTPEVHNPSDGNHGYYELNKVKEKFPNTAHKRCLIGEWLYQNFYPVPTDQVIPVSRLFAEFPELYPLRFIANEVQTLADANKAQYRPPAWRQVAKDIRFYLAPELAR